MKTKPESKDVTIRQNFSEADARYLESRGVPASDLLPYKRGWSLNDSLIDVHNEGPRGNVTSVLIKKQRKFIDRFFAHPFDSFRCMCISSVPSDMRAKQLAVQMFWHASQEHRAGNRPNRRSFSTPPLWHRLYGGFDEPLMNHTGERPSLLVLTNVLEDSTASKIEKTRDLLEKFSEVPRIIVTGGTDPLQIFRTRLFYPVDACVFLDSAGNSASIDRVL
jgi:hypothetical protein